MASRFLAPLTGNRGLFGSAEPFFELHREMNRLFDDTMRGMGASMNVGMQNMMTGPRIDLHQTEKGLELSAELPGCAPEDIDIRLDGDMLTISGEKRNQRQNEKAQIVERSYGAFTRRISLPFQPQSDAVQADFKDGVLTVSLGQPTQQETSKRIEVRSSGGKDDSSKAAFESREQSQNEADNDKDDRKMPQDIEANGSKTAKSGK
ncbi:MAG: Hsp20/alpha crystallin family protein [Sphingorhabdus sp.]